MRAVRHLTLIVAIFIAPALAPAQPQGRSAGVNARGVVEEAQITGIGEDEVSQDLRDAVRKLVGQPFDQQVADDLVSRIQAELPGVITTARLVPGDQSDRVKVLFVVEKSNEEPG